MKISRQFRIAAAVLVGGIVVASSACSVEPTAPPVKQAATTPEAASRFVPTDAQKALIGVVDGTYVVTFDPKRDQVFSLGPNRLEIPAHSVCRLGKSGYGPEFWNAPCTPQKGPVTLTIRVKNANSDKPWVDFQPAMRFNPETKVSLYFYVPKATRAAAKNWVIMYCPSSNHGSGKCVNEALTDRDLQTYVDYGNSILFRRVKHFSVFAVDGIDSGYVVGE